MGRERLATIRPRRNRVGGSVLATKTSSVAKSVSAAVIDAGKLLLIVIVTGSSANAAETYDFYNGVRSLGMGGAYTAVVNDETSLLTNPAGLAKLRDVIVTIANPELSGSANDTRMTTLNNLNAQEPNDLLALTQKAPGYHWNAKAQAFPSIVGPGLGFGLLGKYQYDAQYNASTNDFRLDYTNDFAATFGFALRFWGGVLKIGQSVRYIDRTEVHKDFDTTKVTSIDLSQVASEGTGVATDTGLIVTLPIAWLPQFALVARDWGGTSYGLSNGMFMSTSSRPQMTPQTYDLGIGVFPILSNHNRLSFTVDYHDVLDAWNNSSTLEHLHAGMEVNLGDVFFVRGGMNQGYWTAGLELALEIVQIQFASYGAEIGTSSNPTEDRRFVGEVGFRF